MAYIKLYTEKYNTMVLFFTNIKSWELKNNIITLFDVDVLYTTTIC